MQNKKPQLTILTRIWSLVIKNILCVCKRAAKFQKGKVKKKAIRGERAFVLYRKKGLCSFRIKELRKNKNKREKRKGIYYKLKEDMEFL